MDIRASALCLVCLVSCVSSSSSSSSSTHAQPPPRGCGVHVDPPYRVLCDLDHVWGVVLEAVACGGVLTSLVLSVVLLAKLHCVGDPDRRSGLGPLLLLLVTLTGLFSLSLAYLVGKNQALCVVRRALWGPLFALCFSCLLVQGLRLRRLAAGRSSPAGGSLVGLGTALALVQGIISGEWVLLTVVREGHPACDYPPVDFALTCAYTLGLLLVAMGLALGVVLCGGELESGGRDDAARSGEEERKKWRCNGVWLFLSCLASALLWVAWLGFYLYGNPALRGARGRAERAGAGGRRGPKLWDEPALAVALVAQGWILLVLHAVPEAHSCLRRPLQLAGPDFFDSAAPRPAPHFGEERTARTLRPFADNQAFSMEEQSATLRGTYRSNQGSLRPGIPFRGHMYQPTEMALVMNGGATASVEEVIFVSEKPGPRSIEIVFDQAKRQALQRDIDLNSQPRELGRPMVAQGMITVDMVAGKIKEQDTLAKEKKPRRQKDKDISEEQVIWVDNASLKTPKNNKKKKKADTKEDSSPNREIKTMKKKKKQLEGKGSVSVLEPPLTQEEPSGKKQKKPKKTNDESVQSEAAGGLRADKDVTTLATKKKKRGAKSPVTKTIATEEESQGVPGGPSRGKRKAQLEVVDDETVEKKAKKGKQDKTKQTKAKKAPSSVIVIDEESPKPKKKKKQAKQGEKEVAAKVEVTQEGSVVDDKGPKRKKHKNRSGQTVMDTAQNTETFVFVASDSKGKGKRGIKAPEEIQIKGQQEEVEISVDKKKKKKCTKIKLKKDAPGTEPTPEVVPHKDVVFLSEKTGNRDEVTINQERRMALQMDIDKESHPKIKAKPLAAQGFGQWSTAQFDSTDKQQKFLRLMGGFKAAKTSSGPGAERPNMALAQDKQRDLQQALLGEFERAQSRRVDFSARGAGLGFSAPPPSKKFSIDVNASRSVRFDD